MLVIMQWDSRGSQLTASVARRSALHSSTAQVSCPASAKHVRVDPTKPVAEAAALRVAKALGVETVITGTLKLSGNTATVNVSLTSSSTGRKRALPAISCALSSLPKAQVSLTQEISRSLKLALDGASARELGRANFSRPEVLALFGHSFLAENAADAESYRWKAYDAEPHSSFAAIRLLELYAYGPMLGRDIYDCTRLPETRRVIAAQFKDNTAMAVADAVIVMNITIMTRLTPHWPP